jgi:hypothetical protein
MYEYDCPPTPYNGPPTFLPDWMGSFLAAGAFTNSTLVDLSLPGTHDSITYDLSLTVSEDGLAYLHRLQEILHKLSGGSVKLLPDDLEEFFRMQAKTQALDITQQLDNGIRFIDFRIMRESDKAARNESHWYSIHLMQSRETVPTYLRQIRSFLDQHPHEIVVLWLSQHGNPSATGEDQFPGVTLEEKNVFWQTYVSIFDGLLQDTRVSSVFETPVANLISRQHRVITFASDYEQLTNRSPYALDAKRIQNTYDGGDGVFDAATVVAKHDKYFRNAANNNKQVKQRSGFTLLGMNTAVSSWQTLHMAEKLFLRLNLYPCASHIKIPGVAHWCPETLLDVAQLASYYNQLSFETAFQAHHAFPMAFYLDVLDYDGTIRTGTQLLDGADRGSSDFKDSKYAYVDTVLGYNLRKSCPTNIEQGCAALAEKLRSRRQAYPLQLWDDFYYGRHRDWPNNKSSTIF